MGFQGASPIVCFPFLLPSVTTEQANKRGEANELSRN